MPAHYWPHAPEFAAAIEANRTATAVPVDEVMLTADEATMTIRKRGAFVTRLSLFNNNELVDVLYAESDKTRAKLVASHGMTPVGPSEDIGGQHGPLRWAEYTQGHTFNSGGIGYASLHAEVGDLPVGISRTFTLHNPSHAEMALSIANRSDDSLRTSIGEHLYFNLPRGSDVGDIRLDGHTIDQLLHPGAATQIGRGEAQFWPDYASGIVVTMPDGRDVGIASKGQTEQPRYTNRDFGMLLWQRPGEPFVCLEPTLGFAVRGNEVVNDGLEIPSETGRITVATHIGIGSHAYML